MQDVIRTVRFRFVFLFSLPFIILLVLIISFSALCVRFLHFLRLVSNYCNQISIYCRNNWILQMLRVQTMKIWDNAVVIRKNFFHLEHVVAIVNSSNIVESDVISCEAKCLEIIWNASIDCCDVSLESTSGNCSSSSFSIDFILLLYFPIHSDYSSAGKIKWMDV